MKTQMILLVDWNNGTLMIGLFALVVVLLGVATISMMNSGTGKDKVQR